MYGDEIHKIISAMLRWRYGMKNKSTKHKAPELVYKDGKPSAVIIDINEYQEMLERLEDADDLKMLKDMRKKQLKFRKLDDFLKETAGRA